MIKTFINYKILEKCIDIIFNIIQNEFKEVKIEPGTEFIIKTYKGKKYTMTRKSISLLKELHGFSENEAYKLVAEAMEQNMKFFNKSNADVA